MNTCDLHVCPQLPRVRSKSGWGGRHDSGERRIHAIGRMGATRPPHASIRVHLEGVHLSIHRETFQRVWQPHHRRSGTSCCALRPTTTLIFHDPACHHQDCFHRPDGEPLTDTPTLQLSGWQPSPRCADRGSACGRQGPVDRRPLAHAARPLERLAEMQCSCPSADGGTSSGMSSMSWSTSVLGEERVEFSGAAPLQATQFSVRTVLLVLSALAIPWRTPRRVLRTGDVWLRQ